MKTLALMGMPGTGKTTIVRRIMGELRGCVDFKQGLILGHHYQRYYLCILGNYGLGVGTFAGTDKLSMSCQPEVMRFITSLPKTTNILFEGDRLSNQKFLDFCATQGELHPWMIYASSVELTRRYAQRGSNQSLTFLKGRATKYANLSKALPPQALHWAHETPADTQTIARAALQLLGITLS